MHSPGCFLVLTVMYNGRTHSEIALNNECKLKQHKSSQEQNKGQLLSLPPPPSDSCFQFALGHKSVWGFRAQRKKKNPACLKLQYVPWGTVHLRYPLNKVRCITWGPL